MTHDRAGMIRKFKKKKKLSFAFLWIFGGVLYYTRGRAHTQKYNFVLASYSRDTIIW